jgi:hypothetical protein
VVKQEKGIFMFRYGFAGAFTTTRALIFSLAVTVAGCTTTEFDLEKEVFERQIQQVRIGMSFKDFQAVFPQTISRGGDKQSEGMVTAFEVAYNYYSFHDTGNEIRNDFTGTERVLTWFFFLDGKLIKYGKPEAWPTSAKL